MSFIHVVLSPLAILACLLTFSNKGEGVKITEIQVPDFIQNGTTSPVVLDCDYTLDADEDPRGLTVKWFFDEQPTPVYQWAYGYRPQASGQLSGRVNLEYKASPEGYKVNRPIHIINPTYDLSGNYRCQVATFNNEESRNKNMTIYVPVKKVDFKVVKPEDDTVNISCNAEGLFPTPEMTIFISKKQSHEIDSIKRYTSYTTNDTNGVYDISATMTIGDEGLPSPTLFECELRIPGTNYTLMQSHTYYPGGSSHISVDQSVWILMLTIYVTYTKL